MPRLDYKTCKGCGRKSSEAGLLSYTRLCQECSHQRLLENVDGLHTHSGAPFERWRRAMAASVGGVLLDDVLANAQTGDTNA